MYVASTLGVPMHKLVCKTKRIGGGFGGKETRRCDQEAVSRLPPALEPKYHTCSSSMQNPFCVAGQWWCCALTTIRVQHLGSQASGSALVVVKECW